MERNTNPKIVQEGLTIGVHFVRFCGSWMLNDEYWYK